MSDYQPTNDERQALRLLVRSGCRGGPSPAAFEGNPEGYARALSECAQAWRLVLGERLEGRALECVRRHLADPERGRWWPTPADLAGQLRPAPQPEACVDPRAERAHAAGMRALEAAGLQWDRGPFDEWGAVYTEAWAAAFDEAPALSVVQ